MDRQRMQTELHNLRPSLYLQSGAHVSQWWAGHNGRITTSTYRSYAVDVLKDMTKPRITPKTVRSWLLTASFALENLSITTITRTARSLNQRLCRICMINNLLTQRNKSEEEDLRPYILDDRRPELHFSELSREYSVLPHGERESREDDERGEEGGLEQRMLCSFKYVPITVRAPSACPSRFMSYSPLHSYEDEQRDFSLSGVDNSSPLPSRPKHQIGYGGDRTKRARNPAASFSYAKGCNLAKTRGREDAV